MNYDTLQYYIVVSYHYKYIYIYIIILYYISFYTMFIKSILSQLSMMMSRVKSAEVPMVPVKVSWVASDACCAVSCTAVLASLTLSLAFSCHVGPIANYKK